jgi:hypothetical protein
LKENKGIIVDVWLDERIVAIIKQRFDGDLSEGVNTLLKEHFAELEKKSRS